MKSFPLVLLALCSALAGCNQAGTEPDDFRATQAPWSFDSLLLEWRPPTTGDLTGYELEWRVAQGPFALLGAAGPQVIGAQVTLGTSTPDATDIEFRLRALPDPKGTRVASAVVHRGVRPPVLTCADGGWQCIAGPDGFSLGIQNRSAGANALHLKRQKLLPDTSAWIPGPSFTLPPDATTYVDPLDGDWSEEAEYAYTLTAEKGGRLSSEVTVYTARLPLLAPAQVVATPVAGGIQVSFQNRSSRAQCLSIAREAPQAAPQTVAACLTPPEVGATTTFLDDHAPTAGIVRYRVAVLKQYVQSAWATSDWILPAPPAGLSAKIVTVPPGLKAVRLASGGFATYDVDSQNFVTFTAPGPGGNVPLRIPSGWWNSGALATDPGGQVDGLAARCVTGAPDCEILHASFDGSAWSLEEIGRGTSWPPVALDVGLDGTLRAAWASGGDIVVATRAGGTWQSESLTGALGPNRDQFFAITGDEQGTTHVVHGEWPGLVHRYRDIDGWRSEPVPGAPSNAPVALLPGPGVLRLVALGAVAERSPVEWGGFEALAGIVAAGRSADGSRAAVAGLNWLWLRDANGTRTLNRNLSQVTALSTGIGADGKAWILERQSGISAAPEVFAILYEEL